MSENNCIRCAKEVRPRQEGLQCEDCNQWQHRTCNTGISRTVYRDAVKGHTTLDWKCVPCAGQINVLSSNVEPSESTTQSLVEESMDIDVANLREDVSDNNHPEESFRCSVDFSQPNIHDESSIDELEPSDSEDIIDIPVQYEIVKGGTSRGKDLLVTTTGYAFTVKNVRGPTINWWCQVRGKHMRCPASVSQRGDRFITGIHQHTQQSDPGLLKKTKIKLKVKQTATSNIFRPAMGIVEETIRGEVADGDFSLPKPHLLQRTANRCRQKLRPADPRDLEFEVDNTYIPSNFLRKDIIVDGARHLVFATDTQLELLGKAKRWYMDATFKVVKDPFEQLFSIHAFLKKDDDTKQVPLIFVLMSRRRAKDYKKVLKKVKTILPDEPRVTGFVTDFEAALWKAVRSEFPQADINGCAFHWSQAVWRKVQNLGLATQYTKKEGTYKFVRKLFALPFLPAEHIVPTFNYLKEKNCTQLDPLMDYVANTWINSSTWSPDNWSVYGQSVRTNNDVEGWHRRLNYRASGIPPFYILIDRLHEEAVYITIQWRLISERKLCRYQRKKFANSQKKLFELWKKYQEGEKTATQLLKSCAAILAPPTSS